MKRYFVYMLRCRGGSLYTGFTDDPARRFCLHCRGKGARYTRSFPPEELSALWEAPDERTARSLEYQIKRLKTAQKQILSENPAALRDLILTEAVPVPGTPYPASDRPVPALKEATRCD